MGDGRDENHESSEAGSSGAALRTGSVVMMIEDDELLGKMVELLLSMEGFTVLRAEGETEAVEMGEEYRGVIDFLLADVRLKEGSGPGAAKQLSRRFPDMKIAFMSGYSREDLVEKGLLHEEDAFLPKPFDVRAFRSLIHTRFPKEVSWIPAR